MISSLSIYILSFCLVVVSNQSSQQHSQDKQKSISSLEELRDNSGISFFTSIESQNMRRYSSDDIHYTVYHYLINDEGEIESPYPAELSVNGDQSFQKFTKNGFLDKKKSDFSEVKELFASENTIEIKHDTIKCESTFICPQELEVKLNSEEEKYNIDLSDESQALVWDTDENSRELILAYSWTGGSVNGVYREDTQRREVVIPDSGELKFNSSYLSEIPHDTNRLFFTFYRFAVTIDECKEHTNKVLCFSQFIWSGKNGL